MFVFFLAFGCPAEQPPKDSGGVGDSGGDSGGDTGTDDTGDGDSDTGSDTGDSAPGDTADSGGDDTADSGGDDTADSGDTGDADAILPQGRHAGDTRLPGTATTLSGDRYADAVGWTLAVGDVDGDGVDDILTGSPLAERDESDGGVAWLYAGPVTADADFSAATALVQGEEGTWLGSGLAILGDTDGNGLYEVALTANCSYEESFPNCPSTIYLFEALAGERDAGDALVEWESEDGEADGAGIAMLGGTDFSGDGNPDLVVGARFWNGYAGSVYVLDEPTAGGDLDDVSARFYAVGAGDSRYFGSALVDLGDLDGDGQSDLGVGWGGLQTDEYYAGGLAVFLGPLTGGRDATDHDGLVEGQDYGEGVASLPSRASGVGDVTGDGTPDVAVSAPESSDPETEAGVAYLVDGTELLGGASVRYAAATLRGDDAYAEMGSALSNPGDLDGDGYAELLVGSQGDATYAGNGGLALLLYGPVSGNLEAGDADAAWYGDNDQGWLGRTLGWGELTGDAYLDLVLGAPQAEGLSEHAGAIYIVPGTAP